MLIDSCLDPNREPAALSYLASIGVDAATAVQLIIATHWHDDHIRGISKVLEACNNARFCCSSALGKNEFLTMVASFQQRLNIKATSGVQEIDRVFDILESRRQSPVNAIADRTILNIEGGQLAHSLPVEVRTLSPSDTQFQLFLAEIASLIPGMTTKRRSSPQSPNHVSVVTWISLGDMAILLGADLENQNDQTLGWAAILNSPGRPNGRAAIFKVAHHGSANGHHDGIWNDMLVQAPLALLTPWNRSSKLPQSADVDRIVRLTPNAYSTAKIKRPKPKANLHPAVERQLKEMGVELRLAEPLMGAIRLRTVGVPSDAKFKLELHGRAGPLAEIFQD